jgi:hypothetical protein
MAEERLALLNVMAVGGQLNTAGQHIIKLEIWEDLKILEVTKFRKNKL